MDAPTVADVKSWSKVRFDELDEPFTDDELEVLVARSNDYLVDVTGQQFDTMPSPFVTLSEQCVQMRAEQLAFQAQPDYIEDGSDDQIASFTASTYSETRKDDKGGATTGVFPQVNSWGALNRLLWMLMTDDMRAFWREVLGIMPQPGFEVTEVDWSAMGGFGDSDSGLIWGA